MTIPGEIWVTLDSEPGMRAEDHLLERGQYPPGQLM